MPKAPEDCQDMKEVRVGVDATDRALMELLATRFGYMRAAARIKPTREAVRDNERKAYVIDQAIKDAETRGIPSEVIADIWERLVEGSIAYEFDVWDETRS
ncbi:MAG: chorismate mutase [Pseudomonadota bacterium]